MNEPQHTATRTTKHTLFLLSLVSARTQTHRTEELLFYQWRVPDPGVTKLDISLAQLDRIFSLNTGYRVGPTVACLSLRLSVLVPNRTSQIPFYISFQQITWCVAQSRQDIDRPGRGLKITHTRRTCIWYFLLLLTAPCRALQISYREHCRKISQTNQFHKSHLID